MVWRKECHVFSASSIFYFLLGIFQYYQVRFIVGRGKKITNIYQFCFEFLGVAKADLNWNKYDCK